MGSNYCIFVIAADDLVIRSVINKSVFGNSLKSNSINKITGNKYSEDYLDKFFQQTFRLPEYMETNLAEFALHNFKSTKLYDKLLNKVDFRHLISIILPTDVSSPRKIKRLLNEFISLYEIVEKRENQVGGQLWPGLLTGEPKFLGKFSTIRAEFPEFYAEVIKDPELLSKVTIIFQQKQGNDKVLEELKKKLINTNYESLENYLKKTQFTTADDIYPYIWLSQDSSSRDLLRDDYRQLIISLKNNDFPSVQSLIEQSENNDYSTKIIKSALGIIERENQLFGIELQNGIKVLSNLLPKVDEDLRPEVALVLLTKFPKINTDDFSSFEILTVLKWAFRENIQYKTALVDQLLIRLDDSALREETFTAILENYDVIVLCKAKQKVQSWLNNLLLDDNQNQNQQLTDDEKTKNNENRLFAEKVISLIPNFSPEEKNLMLLFSDSILPYIVSRLMGYFEEIPTVYLIEETGQSFEKAINVIGNYVLNGGDDREFWITLSEIMEGTTEYYEYQFGSNKVREFLEIFPQNFVVNMIVAIISGISNIHKSIPPEVSIKNWFEKEIGLIFYLQRKDKSVFSIDSSDKIRDSFTKLLSINELIDQTIKFIKEFISEFGSELSEPFVKALISSFDEKCLEPEYGGKISEALLGINKYLDETQRVLIINSFGKLISSNNSDQITQAITYFNLFKGIEEYSSIFKDTTKTWLSYLENDPQVIFDLKLSLLLEIVQKGFLNADIFVEKIISLIPFGGDIQKIELAMANIDAIKKDLSENIGKKLFEIVLLHFSQFGSAGIIALLLISKWVSIIDESSRRKFSELIQNNFNDFPKQCLEILSISWEYLLIDEIQKHLIKIFSFENLELYDAEINISTRKAMKAVNNSRRLKLITEVFKILMTQDKAYDRFISIAIDSLNIDDVLILRTNAINSIREDTRPENPDNEFNFNILMNTCKINSDEKKPIVDLFETMFGLGKDEIILANRFVVSSIHPLKIYSSLKHSLARKMSDAIKRLDDVDLINSIKDNATQLGFGPNSWAYKGDWKN